MEETPPDRDPFRLRDDPGWDPRRTGDRPDGLVGIRMAFLALCAALVAVAVAVGLLTGSVADRDPRVGTATAAVAVVVAGLVGLGLLRFLPVRLDCADELALARSWRSRYFARAAASMLPALAGFAAFAATGVPALYPLGLVFTATGLAIAGPFHATLVRDQERLALDGCAISLVPALRRPITEDTR